MARPRPRPLSFVQAFLWTFVASLLLVGLLQISTGIWPVFGASLVNLGALEVLVFVSATLGVLRVHAPAATAGEALAARTTPPALLLLGLALGLALHAPAESVQRLVELVTPTPSELLALRAELFRADTPLRTAAIVLVAGCAVPLVEELFFRGALFSGLAREHSARAASIVTALCFALGRPDPRAWPALLLVGASLSYVRLVGGSVLPCIALHVGFNGAEIAAAFSGAAPAGASTGMAWPALLIGWACSLGLLVAIQYAASRSDEVQRAREQDGA